MYKSWSALGCLVLLSNLLWSYIWSELLISTSCASEKTHIMETSPIILTKALERENKSSELHYSRATFTWSVGKRKLCQPPKVSKLTRSAIDKGARVLDDRLVLNRRSSSLQPIQEGLHVLRFVNLKELKIWRLYRELKSIWMWNWSLRKMILRLSFSLLRSRIAW